VVARRVEMVARTILATAPELRMKQPLWWRCRPVEQQAAQNPTARLLVLHLRRTAQRTVRRTARRMAARMVLSLWLEPVWQLCLPVCCAVPQQVITLEVELPHRLLYHLVRRRMVERPNRLALRVLHPHPA